MTYFPVGRLKSVPSLANLNDVQLSRLAESACNAVENYCGRTFQLQDYDELYPGTGSRSLFLNQYPVTKITAVRSGQQPAVQIQNNQANIQAATVEITSTSLILTRTTNGTATETVLSYADYPTLGELTTAIYLAGNGWYATCNGQFSGWSSADLAVYRQTLSARQTTANLSPHYHYLTNYELNPNSGELTTRGGWFGGGLWSYRVQYRAGFDPVPEELIQATIELAAATYSASKGDVNLVSESLGSYSYTRSAEKGLKDLSVQAFSTLRFFRKPRVPLFGVR